MDHTLSNILDHIHKIREIIRAGKLNIALDQLSDLSVEIYSSPLKSIFEEIKLRNRIIGIESKWNHYQSDSQKEILSFEQNKLRKNQIQDIILAYLDTIEEHCNQVDSNSEESTILSHSQWYKYMLVIAILFLIIAFVSAFILHHSIHQTSNNKSQSTSIDTNYSKCKNINLNHLSIKEANGKSILISKNQLIIKAKNKTDLNKAKTIIHTYKLEKNCSLTTSSSSMKTFLTNNFGIASGKPLENEDCIYIVNSGKLRIRNQNDQFFIYDRNTLIASLKTKEEAKQLIKLIQLKEAAQICYVGRPSPSMMYLKK